MQKRPPLLTLLVSCVIVMEVSKAQTADEYYEQLDADAALVMSQRDSIESMPPDNSGNWVQVEATQEEKLALGEFAPTDGWVQNPNDESEVIRRVMWRNTVDGQILVDLMTLVKPGYSKQRAQAQERVFRESIARSNEEILRQFGRVLRQRVNWQGEAFVLTKKEVNQVLVQKITEMDGSEPLHGMLELVRIRGHEAFLPDAERANLAKIQKIAETAKGQDWLAARRSELKQWRERLESNQGAGIGAGTGPAHYQPRSNPTPPETALPQYQQTP